MEKMSVTIPFRGWNDLDALEKEKIWHHLRASLEEYRFAYVPAISRLNEIHKWMSPARQYLKNPSEGNAHSDFLRIFLEDDQDVVFELISCFVDKLIQPDNKDVFQGKNPDETQEEYEERFTNWRYIKFDNLAKTINDIFEQFGVNFVLSRSEFIPRQEEKITDEIYQSVLKILSGKKWKAVDDELGDAFKDYRKRTPTGYSSAITHTIAALEAFLKIVLYGDISKGSTLTVLIREAVKKDAIPSDSFSAQIFKNIESVLLKERKQKGDAHPKKKYADWKSALLVLNLAMVFIQHSIQD